MDSKAFKNSQGTIIKLVTVEFRGQIFFLGGDEVIPGFLRTH